MKTVRTVIIVSFVLGLAMFSFSQTKFVAVGKVTAVNGSKVTIADDAGNTATIEGTAKNIKVGDQVFIIDGNPFPQKVTEEEKTFAAVQCKIDRADVDVIPRLEAPTRDYLIAGLKNRDCGKLSAFVTSRAYFHTLRKNMKIPQPPVGWNVLYLTDQEFNAYLDIMSTAQW